MSVSPPADAQESSSRYLIEKQNVLEKTNIWVIETASFKLGYNWNHLDKFEEFLSDLHMRYIVNIWANYNSPNQT